MSRIKEWLLGFMEKPKKEGKEPMLIIYDSLSRNVITEDMLREYLRMMGYGEVNNLTRISPDMVKFDKGYIYPEDLYAGLCFRVVTEDDNDIKIFRISDFAQLLSWEQKVRNTRVKVYYNESRCTLWNRDIPKYRIELRIVGPCFDGENIKNILLSSDHFDLMGLFDAIEVTHPNYSTFVVSLKIGDETISKVRFSAGEYEDISSNDIDGGILWVQKDGSWRYTFTDSLNLAMIYSNETSISIKGEGSIDDINNLLSKQAEIQQKVKELKESLFI